MRYSYKVFPHLNFGVVFFHVFFFIIFCVYPFFLFFFVFFFYIVYLVCAVCCFFVNIFLNFYFKFQSQSTNNITMKFQDALCPPLAVSVLSSSVEPPSQSLAVSVSSSIDVTVMTLRSTWSSTAISVA